MHSYLSSLFNSGFPYGIILSAIRCLGVDTFLKSALLSSLWFSPKLLTPLLQVLIPILSWSCLMVSDNDKYDMVTHPPGCQLPGTYYVKRVCLRSDELSVFPASTPKWLPLPWLTPLLSSLGAIICTILNSMLWIKPHYCSYGMFLSMLIYILSPSLN